MRGWLCRHSVPATQQALDYEVACPQSSTERRDNAVGGIEQLLALFVVHGGAARVEPPPHDDLERVRLVSDGLEFKRLPDLSLHCRLFGQQALPGSSRVCTRMRTP